MLLMFKDEDFRVTFREFYLQICDLVNGVIDDPEECEDERAKGDDRTPVRFPLLAPVAFTNVAIVMGHVAGSSFLTVVVVPGRIHANFFACLCERHMLYQHFFKIVRHSFRQCRASLRALACLFNTVD